MINRARKVELINNCRMIFTGLPEEIRKQGTHIKGNQSLAQVIVNRMEQIAKTPDEFEYMKDTFSVMMTTQPKDSPIITDPNEIKKFLQ